MNRYEVELPNGKTATFNSKREYTHGVISREVENGIEKDWALVSTNGSLTLAQKSLEQLASRWGIANPASIYFGTEFRIVEVRVAA